MQLPSVKSNDMFKLVIKSSVFGFITGTIFLGLASFGLFIAFLEVLRPILMPGIDLFQPLYRNANASLTRNIVIGFILNGLIYTILFLNILMIRKHVASRKVKLMAILFVVLAFLGITGMLDNFYYSLTQ